MGEKVIDNKDIVVIGAGAIGIALAVILRYTTSRQVYLWGRQGAQPGTYVLNDDRRSWHATFTVPPTADFRPALVFLTVKAFDVLTAAQTHRHLFSPTTPAVVLANGNTLPLVAALARDVPAIWRLGTVTMGVREDERQGEWRRMPGQIAWGARPGEAVGFEKPLPVESEILQGGAVAEGMLWLDAAAAAVARKWLFNTTLNTFLASQGYTRNGEAAQPGARPLLQAFFREAWDLGQSLFGPWSEDYAVMEAALMALIAATADNENSMVRDVRLGRHTESAYLAGAAARDPIRFPRLAAAHAQLGG